MARHLPIIVVLLCCGCGAKQPPGTVPGPPQPEIVDDPVTEEEPETVEALYEVLIPFGPCRKLEKVYRKEGDAFSVTSTCPDVPSYTQMTEELSEVEFRQAVYYDALMVDSASEYGEVDVGEIEDAPGGTTSCSRSHDKAHTVCRNAAGVITYQGFDGTKLDPPRLDVNRSRILRSYVEK